MARKKPARHDETTELMKTMLIVQLALAGVPRDSIRSIIGCDIYRVANVLKFLKRSSAKK